MTDPTPDKHPTPWRGHRVWLLASVAAAIAICVPGLVWMEGFLASATASAAAIFVTVPVTVLVVEVILDRRREEQWKLVRQQTGDSIEGLAQQAAHDFHLALLPERRGAIPSPAVIAAGQHALILRDLADALRERDGDDDDAVTRLHGSLAQPLYHLAAMAPRIYAAGDPMLAQYYGTLEQQTWAWERSRHQHEDLQVGVLWTNAADTAAALADLVEHAHALKAPRP